MPTEALMLALVIIGGGSFGVIVGRVLMLRKQEDEAPAVVDEPIFPLRELDAVLAPYQPAA